MQVVARDADGAALTESPPDGGASTGGWDCEGMTQNDLCNEVRKQAVDGLLLVGQSMHTLAVLSAGTTIEISAEPGGVGVGTTIDLGVYFGALRDLFTAFASVAGNDSFSRCMSDPTVRDRYCRDPNEPGDPGGGQGGPPGHQDPPVPEEECLDEGVTCLTFGIPTAIDVGWCDPDGTIVVSEVCMVNACAGEVDADCHCEVDLTTCASLQVPMSECE